MSLIVVSNPSNFIDLILNYNRINRIAGSYEATRGREEFGWTVSDLYLWLSVAIVFPAVSITTDSKSWANQNACFGGIETVVMGFVS